MARCSRDGSWAKPAVVSSGAQIKNSMRSQFIESIKELDLYSSLWSCANHDYGARLSASPLPETSGCFLTQGVG